VTACAIAAAVACVSNFSSATPSLCWAWADVRRDDGHLAVGIIDSTHSRSGTVAAGLHMRNGKYLLQHRAVQPFLVREFKLRPKDPAEAARFTVMAAMAAASAAATPLTAPLTTPAPDRARSSSAREGGMVDPASSASAAAAPKPLVPFNLDGDPVPAQSIHVKCLQKAISVFYMP
jgi:diacylglycerol kinase family enzyme